MTPHRAIDWDAVYARAALVIDTVDSSRGRALEPDVSSAWGRAGRPDPEDVAPSYPGLHRIVEGDAVRCRAVRRPPAVIPILIPESSRHP